MRILVFAIALLTAGAAHAQEFEDPVPDPEPPKTECENGQSGRECITSETCTQIGGAGCVCVGAEIVRDADGQVEEIIRGRCEFLGRGTASGGER